MIKQMFKMIWNRKRQNALMTIGIVISFFSLFLVFTTLFYMLNNYFKPLGFEYEDVWYINPGWSIQEPEEILETLRQVEFALDSYPEIEFHSYSNCYLFMPAATSMTQFMNEGEEITVHKGLVGDHFNQVLGIDLIAGRWFDRQDNASQRTPIIINKQTQEEFFPDQDPIGKFLVDDDGEEFAIIGQVGEFRNSGDFTGSKKVFLTRGSTLMGPDWIDSMDGMFSRILFKVKPGSTRELEQRILTHITGIAKDWTVKMGRLDEARESANRQTIVIPIIMGIICAFLILNVALGLFGVIWYNTKRRTSEIGLRRALGSTVKRIHAQIIGEALVLATFGIIIGLFFAIQFPLLGVLGFIGPNIYLSATFISVALIYVITFLCALYPGNQASSIEPAMALHDD
ncbi:MAG: FtsX-like permease family protein [Candidatus Marinimicrobia bacterium]|jgi:putative ABC transport system permease protein|nr:FtsX-like permease family protein [Candidatus Neomarinimicrobiota bacterium]MBT4362700.1 FtsX-like permease family protein [Candidatus Neomarinimicrobiota bacterium]MBT4713291.1 FtsX-like permease family protein [Candidatus Neomarinimicrobiota bacterium]MBT4944811.1 FtsX-like permease family protein [Candidatus Neomarinimicrobiota bacterium]MBT5271648.1 FtsX-like permease family protein [Candidatus Neomarinimicrobiota bacterium]